MTRHSQMKVWVWILLISYLHSISGLPGSYDPVPLTPFNGLKIQRSPLFQNSAVNLNTFYDDGGGGDGDNSKTSSDGSRPIFYPFSTTTTQRPTVIGYAASDPISTPRPIIPYSNSINVTPRSYATSAPALFRSTLPENQPSARPSVYQSSTGFPLLNSPNGVSYGDGRPTAFPPAARAYEAEALPPNFYFISPKDSSSQPPARFQSPQVNLPLTVHPTRGGMRRIPEGLRRTQFYPSAGQPLSPLVRTSTGEGGVTPYSVAPDEPSSGPSLPSSVPQYYNVPATDTYDTFHTFYAPKYSNYIPITRYSHDADAASGQYNVEFESGNGIYQKETGYIKKIQIFNPRTQAYEVRDINVKTGTVSWTSPEGIPFTLSYIADENGFRPIGSHIPSDGSGAAAAGTGTINSISATTVTPRQGYSYGIGNGGNGGNGGYDKPVIPPNPLYHHRQAG